MSYLNATTQEAIYYGGGSAPGITLTKPGANLLPEACCICSTLLEPGYGIAETWDDESVYNWICQDCANECEANYQAGM